MTTTATHWICDACGKTDDRPIIDPGWFTIRSFAEKMPRQYDVCSAQCIHDLTDREFGRNAFFVGDILRDVETSGAKVCSAPVSVVLDEDGFRLP